jgi:type I restriction enzyme, S subunit
LSLFEKIFNNLKQNKELESIRNTLLPKLISGELRVPEAEALIEKES